MIKSHRTPITYPLKRLSVLLSVILTGLLVVGSLAARAELMVGDPAPEFSVMGSDGKLHALSDSRGNNPLVIAFFPKAFTGG
ncbi:MAG: redoxin domain-containing protein [Gammaproteobacteria bacterium]|nr:redoxin domain-containing protein [Gammaproteobacteria bacterium]MBT5202482.1 redoxin domain-containing protein [Gammaproteobacteria bacterium]